MKKLSRNLLRAVWLICFGFIFIQNDIKANVKVDESVIVLKQDNYSIEIIKEGFRFSILKPDGTIWLGADNKSGIELLRTPIVSTELIDNSAEQAKFLVANDIGISACVTLYFSAFYFKMTVALTDDYRGAITIQNKGLYPSYGLSDFTGRKEPYTTEIDGYRNGYLGALADEKPTRGVSNFIVFPKQGIATVNMDPRKKIIMVNKDRLVQGSFYADQMPALYFFMGTLKQIYADFHKTRHTEGYKMYQPKYEWFGVGWEAFGALAWETNHKTVKEDVDRYLENGFPLSWMVVGSGFWPDDPKYFATTSFGYWDKNKYPNPKEFIDYFHKKGLKFIIGLRIAFIPNGPYTDEGLTKGYFIKKDGKPRLFQVSFPKPDCYFLDGTNPEAVQWYVDLCAKWEEFGVDGYKEDVYGYDFRDLPDDKLNKVNEALMDKGIYLMGRNNYLGSAMDLHRYEDFNYNQNQDRGPVNGLAFSYSGFPYTYPDIIGGTGLTNKRFGEIPENRLSKYLMREAKYAAVNPSMSVGYGPWNLDNPKVLEVVRDAAQLHDRLHPYIYNTAIQTYYTGFPYTLTPLPLAFPNDRTTYHRENDNVRGYQWMIGDALMAYPLYGEDYEEADARDVYLPEGKWIDYDNGKRYQGPMMLSDFKIPVEKTPIFIGGSGFVVEKVDGKLKGRVYPVGYVGETIFYDKDGKTKSVLSIKDENKKIVSIKDNTTGKSVKAQMVRFAYEFDFIPGHDYSITL